MTNLNLALLEAQKQIGVAIKSKNNPYFSSNYADLKEVIECIKEPLNNNGIYFLQKIVLPENSLPMVETVLTHAESGESLNFSTPIYCNKPNDPQAFGSGITYTKRYALQALLGLPTADDDGNSGSDKSKTQKTIDLEKKIKNKTARDFKENPLTETEKTVLKDICEHWATAKGVDIPSLESMATALLNSKAKKIPESATVAVINWVISNLDEVTA